jgi:hypothetical protein
MTAVPLPAKHAHDGVAADAPWGKYQPLIVAVLVALTLILASVPAVTTLPGH